MTNILDQDLVDLLLLSCGHWTAVVRSSPRWIRPGAPAGCTRCPDESATFLAVLSRMDRRIWIEEQ